MTLPDSLPHRYLPTYRPVLGALVLALVVLAIYGASAGFEFVYDDHVQIERNPWLRAPDGFRMFLIHPFWGFYADRGALPSNYYRPAFGWAYSLVARAFGLQPAPFHIVSVALHLAVTLLVALGAWRLVAAGAEGGERKREIAALAAGLVFATRQRLEADLDEAVPAIVSQLLVVTTTACKDFAKGTFTASDSGFFT